MLILSIVALVISLMSVTITIDLSIQLNKALRIQNELLKDLQNER